MKLVLALAILPLVACASSVKIASLVHVKPDQKYAVTHTDDEWQKLLPAQSYEILRHADTERAFTGKYAEFTEKGAYECAACHQVLFDSNTKFDSGTGWPSFYQEIARGRTLIQSDNTLGMERDEVLCSRCGSHLGHVFDDGPEPTGLRYCMNSAALLFVKK